MPLVSDYQLFKIPLVLAVAALLIFGKFRERLLVILVALVILIGDVGIISNLKNATNRPRPYQALENVRKIRLHRVEIIALPEPCTRGGSMPSGHVANNVAVTWLVFWLYRPSRKIVWIWPALIAYSRVYTGDHFPSDVLVALLVASAYTHLIALLARKVWRWQAPKTCPGLYERFPLLFPAGTPTVDSSSAPPAVSLKKRI